MKSKEQKVNIDTVTQTKDKNKQAEILLGLANAPVVELIIRYDGRTNQIAIGSFGGKLDTTAIYKLLDGAREIVRKQELQTLAKKMEENPE